MLLDSWCCCRSSPNTLTHLLFLLAQDELKEEHTERETEMEKMGKVVEVEEEEFEEEEFEEEKFEEEEFEEEEIGEEEIGEEEIIKMDMELEEMEEMDDGHEGMELEAWGEGEEELPHGMEEMPPVPHATIMDDSDDDDDDEEEDCFPVPCELFGA